MSRVRLPAIAWLVTLAACGPPPSNAVPSGSFSFGVFGDGPYQPWEEHRFERVLHDVNRSDVQWLIHVGDILWYPCSDAAFENRFRYFQSVDHPVVYTPGDNEWTDCYQKRPGGYEPLDRLASIRRIFFAHPTGSLGRHRMELESQGSDSVFAEFVENARWTRGGFVFATIHIVGSDNGLETFPGRTARHDAEVERRTNAAIAWLDETFARAVRDSAKGVVLALHGDMSIESASQPRPGYAAFLAALRKNVAAFRGQVLLIHGDSHIQRVDHPLKAPDGRAYENFTRLETFGSPDVGWVRVVVDTVGGRFTTYERRLMRGW
ncbi:MAG: metallophosphoesterase [Gemmatimonadales bacterium]